MDEQPNSIRQIAADLAPNYDQLRPLGSGGMGDLFLAHKTGLDVPVAVKILKNNVKTQLDERQEAEILKSLKHQYLPKIFDVIAAPQGVLYTVMDYISGDNLKDYIKKNGPVDQKTAYKWATQLCEVTAYLHAQSPAIIHSDIKPGNVMITPDGNICLIDFNTSLLLQDGLTAIGKTDGYAAPEQYTAKGAAYPAVPGSAGLTADFTDSATIYGGSSPGDDSTILPETESHSRNSGRGRRSSMPSSPHSGSAAMDYGPVTKRTDVYSIGATLYYALTGENPPHALTDGKRLSALHPRISRSFLQIIERSMEKMPAKRFCDAAEMGRALAEIHRLDRQYRRIHTLTVLAVCMEILLIAGGAWLLYSGRNQLLKERDENYVHLLNEVQQQRDSGEYEQALALTEQAQTLIDTRMEAHAERATVYYKQALATTDSDGRNALFNLCIDTVQELLDGGYEGGTAAEWAKACFVGAESATEVENYGLAEKWYARSIEYAPSQSNYTGYIYALVMDGKTDEAEQVLEQMRDALSEEDAQYATAFLGAELDCLDGNYRAAIQKYRKMLDSCQDEALLRRGYLAVNNACTNAESVGINAENDTAGSDYVYYADSRISFMEEAIERLPGSKAIFLPLLADAYYTRADLGDDDSSEYLSKARTVYESIGTGSLGYSDRLNLNRIYIRQEEWDLAITDLQAMDSMYAGNYKVKLLLTEAYFSRAMMYAAKWNQSYNQADRDQGSADLASGLECFLATQQYYEASGDYDPETEAFLSTYEEILANAKLSAQS